MSTARLSTRIEAAARLHLGFLDPAGTLGRRFGSIGLSIEGLPTIVDAAPSERLEVLGVQSERARAFVERVLARYRLPPTVALRVDAAPPSHAGLGSGTQLALATAAAVLGVFERAASASELAAVLGRGVRSGIGLSLFESGGLVVDGGRGSASTTPPVVSRVEFPADWFAILVLDRCREGLSGAAETAAFRALPPMPAATAAHLCHLTLMGLLPATVERDFPAFSRCVAEVQAVVGDYFAAAQAGRYASAHVSEAIEYCIGDLGLAGVGQSSWGPTGFAFVAGSAAADAARAALEARFGGSGLEFRVCAPRNRGAARDVARARQAATG